MIQHDFYVPPVCLRCNMQHCQRAIDVGSVPFHFLEFLLVLLISACDLGLLPWFGKCNSVLLRE